MNQHKTLNDLPFTRVTKRYAVATEMCIPYDYPYKTEGEAWKFAAEEGGYVVQQVVSITLRVMDAC